MSSVGMDCLNNSVLEQFLGAAGVEELRSKIIDVIVEEVRDQIINSSNYIISPDDVSNELFDRVINDVYEEVRDEIKEKMSDIISKKLGTLGI